MNIVGLSAFYHDSSCCLIKDGELVAAASEERFSRLKFDPRIPVNAYRYCLEAGGIGPGDVDVVAYYESPTKKLGRQLWASVASNRLPDLNRLDPGRPEREIREKLGHRGPIDFFEHHQAHAASAFYFSGFREAAILTVDGVGEWATTSYGKGAGDDLELFEEVEFPDSLGLFYSTITSYLGFRVNSDEYKVMGLAPYGEPRHVEQLRRLLVPGPGGQYRLDLDYFDFISGARMYSPRLCELLGQPARERGAAVTPFHQDLARSVQVVLEEMLLEKVRYLAAQVDTRNLCMAGGVALNCVANGRVLREGPFEHLFVQPAAGDAGGCLGAAALAHRRRGGARHTDRRLAHVYLGPETSTEDVAALVAATGVAALDFRGREDELVAAAVDRLERGEVVGWFQGRMEFGPRALGARSILANPLSPDIRERLNRLVKKREDFRPFAPSVLAEHAAEHFDLDHASPFMLETCRVRSRLSLPGITHVDHSARPQTVDEHAHPRFRALLSRFHQRTGCPLLINTSFNVADEPIVCTAAEALLCTVKAGLDAVVLETFLIDRASLPELWPRLVATLEGGYHGPANERGAIEENLYTFV